ASTKATVEPLPLVPATVTTLRAGRPSCIRSATARTRSRPSSIDFGCCCSMYSSHCCRVLGMLNCREQVRASEGRSRGKGGAPALLQSVLSRRSGAPPFPLRFAGTRSLRLLVAEGTLPACERAAGWGGPLGEIKEEAEAEGRSRGTFAQRATPPGKKRPPEAGRGASAAPTGRGGRLRRTGGCGGRSR